MKQEKEQKKKGLKKTSEILNELAQDTCEESKPTYGSVAEKLEHRVFSIGLLLFSLLSMLPLTMIPGFSIFVAGPIAIIALQMIIGKKSFWLPAFIANQELPPDKMASALKKCIPYIEKIERLLKPRWDFMTSRIAEVCLGITMLIIAILLMLPIPFSNLLYAFVLVVFSLGIAEQDGLMITIGFILAIMSLSIIPLLFSLAKTLF